MWSLLDDEAARRIWNPTLASFNDACPYQSYEWGEFRRRMTGRAPLRLVAYDEHGQVIAMQQMTPQRLLPGVVALTSLGGPVGDLGRALPRLPAAMRDLMPWRTAWHSIGARRPWNVEDESLLMRLGWRPAIYRQERPMTMRVDLSPGPDIVWRRSSRAFREKTQRVRGSGITIGLADAPDPDEIVGVLREMEAIKGLAPELGARNIANLAAAFGEHFLLACARDPSGSLTSVHGCLVTGVHALSIVIATNTAGRAQQVSSAVAWRLFEACMERGVQTFDLNGTDPVRSPGVHQFKRSTGAQPVSLLGHYEFASNGALRLLLGHARRLVDARRQGPVSQPSRDHATPAMPAAAPTTRQAASRSPAEERHSWLQRPRSTVPSTPE